MRAVYSPTSSVQSGLGPHIVCSSHIHYLLTAESGHALTGEIYSRQPGSFGSILVSGVPVVQLVDVSSGYGLTDLCALIWSISSPMGPLNTLGDLFSHKISSSIPPSSLLVAKSVMTTSRSVRARYLTLSSEVVSVNA